MNYKHYLLAGVLSLSALATGAYFAFRAENHSEPEKALSTAQEIEITEEYSFAGKDYQVFVDDKLAATISGENIRLVGGDTFTLETIEGKTPEGKSIDKKVLAYEEEDKRYVLKDSIFNHNRHAEFYNADGTLTGHLAEERVKDSFSLGYIFHFMDAEENKRGKSVKIGRGAVINLHTILDHYGNTDYVVDKHAITWPFVDTYTLTVKDPRSEIPLEHAILLVCIEDAIGDSQEEKERNALEAKH